MNRSKRTIRRGDIYYVLLNGAAGHEQFGDRPAVVIQNNTGNRFSPTVIVAPLTSQEKRMHLPTHVYVSVGEHGSVALLEQIATVDKRSLGQKLGKLTSWEMERINSALAVSIGLCRYCPLQDKTGNKWLS